MIFAWLERKIGAGNAVFALFVLLMLLLWGVTSVWNGALRRYWKHEAQQATAAAVIAQGNADSANAGARNATQTRQAIDGQTITLRLETAEIAARIEDHATPETAGVERKPVDADIVRDFEALEHRARAAADRLQRKSPR